MRWILAGVFLAIAASAAWAEPKRYAIEVDRSEVTFTYLLNGSPIKGQFGITVADLLLDFKAFSKSEVEVTLDTASGSAGFPFATNAMKGPEVLNTAAHPTIRFVSSGVETTDTGALVKGDVTVRGVTRPITLDAKLFRQRGTEEDDLSRLSIELTGSINRHDFGASGFRSFVGPDLDIRVFARIQQQE